MDRPVRHLGQIEKGLPMRSPRPDIPNDTSVSDLRQPLASPAHHLPTDICQIDPDQGDVMAAWPSLSEATRAGIIAMVKVTS